MGTRTVKTDREKQVQRVLAAERARRRTETDETIAAYRRYLKRALPAAAVLNVALMVVLISQGVYAFAANLTVLPILWLAWVMLRLAEARDADRPSSSTAQRAWHTIAPDTHRDPDWNGHPQPTQGCVCHRLLKATFGTFDCPVHGRVDGEAGQPENHEAPRDCIYKMGDDACVICGALHPLAPRPDPPEDGIPF